MNSDPNFINFENIEKVATYLLASNSTKLEKRLQSLQDEGFSDVEINLGHLMATQAVFMVVFGTDPDTLEFKTLLNPKA